MYTKSCKDPLKKELVQRAVANFNKSVENFDELWQISEEIQAQRQCFLRASWYYWSTSQRYL